MANTNNGNTRKRAPRTAQAPRGAKPTVEQVMAAVDGPAEERPSIDSSLERRISEVIGTLNNANTEVQQITERLGILNNARMQLTGQLNMLSQMVRERDGVPEGVDAVAVPVPDEVPANDEG